MNKEYAVIVPWTKQEQIDLFCKEWGIRSKPDWLLLEKDLCRVGCGATKNKGVNEAMRQGYEHVIILDDDCFPFLGDCGASSLEELAHIHLQNLQPQRVEMFQAVTSPLSRGTPYKERSIIYPVACSIGFWTNIGAYCAVRQLSYEGKKMKFYPQTIFGKYFALCGMNIAFNPHEWKPWCDFINVDRFDDIWMGWLWQKEAYRKEYCFSLHGPVVRHSRQSNVWANLEAETKYLKQTETLWIEIANHGSNDYETLKRLLP